MKTSNKVLATHMARQARPISGRMIALIFLLFILAGAGVGLLIYGANSKPARYPRASGPISVEFNTLDNIPTAAPVSN